MRSYIYGLAGIAMILSTASPCPAQWSKPLSPADQAIWDKMQPLLKQRQDNADRLYNQEVAAYGEKAVIECRSRGLTQTAYDYCLIAQKEK